MARAPFDSGAGIPRLLANAACRPHKLYYDLEVESNDGKHRRELLAYYTLEPARAAWMAGGTRANGARGSDTPAATKPSVAPAESHGRLGPCSAACDSTTRSANSRRQLQPRE